MLIVLAVLSVLPVLAVLAGGASAPAAGSGVLGLLGLLGPKGQVAGQGTVTHKVSSATHLLIQSATLSGTHHFLGLSGSTGPSGTGSSGLGWTVGG